MKELPNPCSKCSEQDPCKQHCACPVRPSRVGKGQNTSALCTWRGLTTIPTLQKRCQKLPSHPSHHLGLDRKMGSVRSGAGIGTELVLAGPNLKVGDDPHREKCSLLCFFPLTCSFTFPPSIRGKIES